MATFDESGKKLGSVKNLWQSYGLAAVFGVLIAAVAVYGYNSWAKNKLEKSYAAVSLYQEILDITGQMRNGGGFAVDKERIAKLMSVLDKEYRDSVYNAYSLLFKAYDAVQNDDMVVADNVLKHLLTLKLTKEIEAIARIRRAQVLLSLNTDKSRAEGLVVIEKGEVSNIFPSLYGVIKGDLLLANGHKDKARQAYKQAVDFMNNSGRVPEPYIVMKLDDIALMSINGNSGEG